MQGAEPFIESNAFSSDRDQEPLSAQASEAGAVILETQFVKTWLRSRAMIREGSKNRLKGLKAFNQQPDVIEPLLVAAIEFIELGQQHGRLELGKRTYDVAAVLPDLGALENVGVSGQDGAASSGGKQLGAAETQNPHVPPGAGLASLDRGSWHLGGVFDHEQPMSGGDGHDLTHWHNTAV
jgi:hypothetical protein